MAGWGRTACTGRAPLVSRAQKGWAMRTSGIPHQSARDHRHPPLRRLRRLRHLALVPILALSLAAGASTGHVGHAAAATASLGFYVVTSTGDAASCPGGSGAPGYTLRCALADLEANPDGGAISFDINPKTDPGCMHNSGFCTIRPQTDLPTVDVKPITINGVNQNSFFPAGSPSKPARRIQIDGSLDKGGTGIDIDTALRPSVTGLSFTNFGGTGLHVSGPYASVSDCWFGIGSDGTPGGNGVGLWVGDEDSLVYDNVIANNRVGLETYSFGEVIQDNLFGTDATGTFAEPNTQAAMENLYPYQLKITGNTIIIPVGTDPSTVLGYYDSTSVAKDNDISTTPPHAPGSGGQASGTATPELSSSELALTGIAVAPLLYLVRRRRRSRQR